MNDRSSRPREASALLGPDGPLARTLQNYEVRQGQLEMAAAVEHVLANDGILLCEAGTGTGKTLAYLVPAILSGRKIIVSTATRALQEQIAAHDIPLLARALGIEPKVSVMKGLGNYVCRRRLAEFSRGSESLQPRYARALAIVDEWLSRTETGDVAEIGPLPEDDPLLSQVTSSSDTRVGSACSYYEDCFATRMRRAADRARIVVVNHHLFFADLALRGPHPGRVLPDYDAVIFDEAHQLEDIATTFFGFRVSRARVDALVADAERALSRAGDVVGLGASQSAGLLAGIRRASEAIWETLRSEVGTDERRVPVEQGVWAGPLYERWLDLDESLEALGALAASASGQIRESDDFDIAPWADALDVAQRRAADLRQQLAQIAEGASGHVAWFDSDGRRAALAAAPIDLSSTLRARVFEAVPAAVLTSATLTSATARRSVESSAAESLSAEVGAGAGDFTFLRRRLGLDELEVAELVVPSPFDFATNALFYTPSGLVLPNDAGFQAAAVDQIEQLIELTDGGAFVLTTSLRSMNGLCRELRRRTQRPVLLQGAAPKQALVHAFRSSGDAVLVATMSFWEGVDVPGRALRLVIIDKIPFPVPSDPIVGARSLAIEEAGRNPFTEYHLPAAAIALKQGFGRLIRTRTDIGVVALLDERIHRRGYGRWLLGALPPAARTQDYGVVRDFWLSRGG